MKIMFLILSLLATHLVYSQNEVVRNLPIYLESVSESKYLSMEDNTIALGDVPCLMERQFLTTGAFIFSFKGAWLAIDSVTSGQLVLRNEKPSLNDKFCQWTPAGGSGMGVVYLSYDGKYILNASGEGVNLIKSSEYAKNPSNFKGVHWKSTTPQSLKSSYFLRAAGTDKSITVINGQLGNSADAEPAHFISLNGGRTSMINIDQNWFIVDTVNAKIKLSSIMPSVYDPAAQFEVVSAPSPSHYGATHGIRCKLNDKYYYLNNATYSSINLPVLDLDSSLRWHHNGAGLFWQFLDYQAYKKGTLIRYGTTTKSGNNPSSFSAASTGTINYANGQLSFEAGSVSTDNWDWKLKAVSTDTNTFEISLIDANNNLKYIFPTHFPDTLSYGRLLSKDSRGALEVKDSSNWPFKSDLLYGLRTYTKWEMGENVPDVDTIIESIQLMYTVIDSGSNYNSTKAGHLKAGVSWDNGFADSYWLSYDSFPDFNQRGYEKIKETKSGLKYDSYYLTTQEKYFIDHYNFEIVANRMSSKNFSAVNGKVTQPLAYRTVGSDQFYIYGDSDSLIVLRENTYDQGIYDKTVYVKGNSGPIKGASLYDSYMFVVDDKFLTLYTLFGIKNSSNGRVVYLDLGEKYTNSAPVFNIQSHKVYLLSNHDDTTKIKQFGQGLNQYDIQSYATQSETYIPKYPLELFVKQVSADETKLYYQNAKGQLITLKATESTINIEGEPITATKEQILWLKYQTYLTNYFQTNSGMTITPISNGYVASGANGDSKTYAIIFNQDSIKNSTKVSIYLGPNEAFPKFTDLTTVPDLVNNTTTKTASWELKNSDGESLWLEGYPIISYDSGLEEFKIKCLARSRGDSVSAVYYFDLEMSKVTNAAGRINLEWQKWAGKGTHNLVKGSPLHSWFEHYWMQNFSLF